MNENQLEKLRLIAKDIINFSRSRIILNFRFFDVPLSRISFIDDLDSFYCNGKYIIYNSEFIIDAFEKSQELPLRMIIHSLIHCLLGHVYAYGYSFDEVELWNACCDIAVENIVLDMISQTLFVDTDIEKQRCINDISYVVRRMTAEDIFDNALNNPGLKDFILSKADLFKYDDHKYWYDSLTSMQQEIQKDNSSNDKNSYDQNNLDTSSTLESESNIDGEDDQDSNGYFEGNEPKQNNNSTNDGFISKASNSLVYFNKDKEQEEDWKNIGDQIVTEIESFNKGIGNTPGNFIVALKANAKEKYDYETFLTKFAHIHEAMVINDEEFDYVLYTYGLSLYKNMPIIEPLEYKDKKLIQTFVIAIDTSGSTSGELVKKFLRKTFNVLNESGLFTKRCEIRIVQCDTKVQHVDIIHELSEVEQLFSNFQLYGFGGTSFTPVFDYVNKLLETKELTRVDGLIYFTDGQGVFPSKKPLYKTAFIFIEQDEYDWNNYDIPSWAIKFIFDEKEIN